MPAQKIKRALKRVRGIRARTTPLPGEPPIVMLKVQILGCEELMPMDRNGKSDPFITLSLLSHRYTTTVAKRTTNPTWGDAVYEFPVYMSLAGDDDGDGDPTKRNPNRIPEDCPWRTGLGALEFVVWDKDMLRKEYLGEVAVGVGEWFGERREERKESGDKGRKESGDREGERKAYGFDEVGNEPFTLALLSTRAGTSVTGTIKIKMGFVRPEDSKTGSKTSSSASAGSKTPSAGSKASSSASTGSRTPSTGSKTPSSGATTPSSKSGATTPSSKSGATTPSSKSGAATPQKGGAELTFGEIYQELVKRTRANVVSAPPTEGVGTIRSHTFAPMEMEDDGGISSGESDSGDSDGEQSELDEGRELDEDSENENDSAPSTPEDVKTPLASAIPRESVLTPTRDSVAPPTRDSIASPTTPKAPQSLSALYERPEVPPVGILVDAVKEDAVKESALSSSSGSGPSSWSGPSSASGPSAPSGPSATPANATPANATPANTTPASSTPANTTRPSLKSGFSMPRIKFRRGVSSGGGPGSPGLDGAGQFVGGGSQFVGGIGGTGVAQFVGAAPQSVGGIGGTGAPLSAGIPSTASVGLPSTATPGEETEEAATRKGRFRKSWRGEGSGDSKTSDSSAGSGFKSSASGAQSGSGEAKSSSGETKEKKPKTKKRAKKPNKTYSFSDASNDIVGIVMLDIQRAEDLPRLKNMTRTGWDMDPFVVVSFGKKVFRTRVIRHSRSPVWDEKLLFHVRRWEVGFKIQLTILDWDKLSSNDYIGDAHVDVGELVKGAVQPGADGLYAEGALESQDISYTLPLTTSKQAPWEAHHTPTITLRAKYQPYAALRQKFWRQYLKGYDTDDTGALSHVEITSMLDSLGSTLRGRTVDGFFTRFGKRPHEDELSMGEAIRCLEEELGRPVEEKRIVVGDTPFASGMNTPLEPGMGTPLEGGTPLEPGMLTPSGVQTPLDSSGLDTPDMTPVVSLMDSKGKSVHVGEVDFGEEFSVGAFMGQGGYTETPEAIQGSGYFSSSETDDSYASDASEAIGDDAGTTPQNQSPAAQSPGANQSQGSASAIVTKKEEEKRKKRIMRIKFGKKKKANNGALDLPLEEPSRRAGKRSGAKGSAHRDATYRETLDATHRETLETQSFERVINIRTCPLCHRPRLNDKAEVDIVTHLAVCASADWGKVDRIVNGNFVTASQAQRKWYTRIISKVGAGDYRLGANSANIIVQNRMTGQLEEEKMQVYVRLGIRLLYKGAKSRMEGGRARRLLKSLSIKQGLKYDSPESAAEIPAFIAFHGLDVGEVELPLGEYKTFNSFFYRKLKPTARPLETPDDPYRLVSAADCRFMAFESISDATKIWIKGREFGVGKLLNGETTTSNGSGSGFGSGSGSNASITGPGAASAGTASGPSSGSGSGLGAASGSGSKVDPNAPYYDPTPYLSGTLCIFRLAPQDYHRFHSPVKGVVGKMKRVEGEYYTVNPQAIRTTLDVYGDNVRKVVPIHSEEFGVVMCVCVGAMMVGSIETTVEEGQDVERGDEFGYFAFGGSTIVILFEKGRVTWDEDLVVNGKAAVETLVRVGMGIGRGASPSASPS